MKKIMKYTGMWAFSWLQLYLVFIHLTAFMYMDLFTVFYLCGSIIYLLFFTTYQIVCVGHMINNHKQQIFERILLCLMSLMSLAYAIYIFSNTGWLLNADTDIRSILVEITWPLAMILFTSMAVATAIKTDTMLEVEEQKLWPNYQVQDYYYLLTFSILLVLLVLVNSKLIPGLRRDYHQFVRTALQIIGISFLWSYTRYFKVDRMNFYAALLGFLLVFALEALVFFAYVRPGNIIIVDGVSKLITATSILYPVIIGCLVMWLFRSYKLEKK